MHRHQLPDTLSCGSSCIGSCFYRSHISPNHDRYETEADFFITANFYIRSLHHCISRFDCAYQTFCFD
ncbi:hypothetical protein D3C71_2113620 [compost metagenome]